MPNVINEVDLFISKVSEELFKLSLYVNDKFVTDLAYGFSCVGLVDFVDTIVDDIRLNYGDFDVVFNPNVYVS